MLKTLLRNAILSWYDDSLEEYPGLDSEEFIAHVCENTGMSEQQYREIVLT